MSPFQLFKADVVVSPVSHISFFIEEKKKNPVQKGSSKKTVNLALQQSKSNNFGSESCFDAG